MSTVRAHDSFHGLQVGQRRLYVSQPVVVISLVILLEMPQGPGEIGPVGREVDAVLVRRTCTVHLNAAT